MMYKKNNTLNSDQLKSYFQTHVLANGMFHCKHASVCEASHLNNGGQNSKQHFYKGQLHHIGKYYDLSTQDTAFRIMIVGQEYGHEPALVNFAERYDMLMDSAAIGFKARNPHMKGTSSLLRLLHGLSLGTDHAGEFIQVDGESVHLFDTFVLANYLLCSALTGNSAQGQATQTMKNNCAEHFAATLEMLKPSVLIIQGIGFWEKAIKQLFVGGLEKIDDTLYQANFRGNEILMGVFAHPSAAAYGFWGNSVASNYLLNTVKPTVEKMRELLLNESVCV